MEEVLVVIQRMHLADWLLVATVLLLVVLIVLVAVLLRKKPSLDFSPFQLRFELLENGQERLGKGVRDEIARNREEISATLNNFGSSLQSRLTEIGDSLQSGMAKIAGLQKDQLDSFAKQLFMLTQSNEQKFEHMRTTIEAKLSSFHEEMRRQLLQVREDAASSAKELREEVGLNLKTFRDSLISNMGEMSSLQKSQLDIFADRLSKLTETNDHKLAGMRDTIEQRLGFLQTESAKKHDQIREELTLSIKRFTDSNETKLEAVRATVEGRLKQIQEDNSKQLELMRATVDEKLQGTLEKRLGESFKQVSERLEQVHKGLGEMQSLATGVGDLKRALTNVKTRGGWGEIQLHALLEEILSPEQYERNVKTNELSGEIVEFAIRLPGRDEGDKDPVWLPIDAKFPIEDYQRLAEAQENADPEAANAAIKGLEDSIKRCAKDICDKYICPPRTTDFGIMFLPTEGLYAEVVRRSGLVESIQRQCRVVIAGPTTFAALLNSLQMGFRTLAIQKRSSEVWKLLGAVKTEFVKFGDVLDGVKRKLEQASHKMDQAATRSRAIERKLRGVEELPPSEAQLLLGGDGDGIAAVE